MISMFVFAFKSIRAISFSAVKNVTFPQSRKFLAIKTFFHNQGIFSQSRKFSAVKEIFQSKNFSTIKIKKVL